MNFQQESLAKMKDGSKTQTRRLFRETGDSVQIPELTIRTWGEDLARLTPDPRCLGNIIRVESIPEDMIPDDGLEIEAVYKSGRHFLGVGMSYAAAPGRGKKATGRFVVDRLRLQRLKDISKKDSIAEGLVLDETFIDPGTGLGAEWVATFEGKELRGADPRKVYLTLLRRMYPKMNVETQRVLVIDLSWSHDEPNPTP